MNVIFVHNSNYNEGSGFFVGHRFFTFGHVVTRGENPYLNVDGKRIELVNPIYHNGDPKSMDEYDLAVYEIEGYSGDLEFYESDITPGMVCQSQSLKRLGTEYVECDVVVNDFNEGNYFGGLGSLNLKAGCSGSPLLLGNKVIGIMTAGNNDDLDNPKDPSLPLNFCAFLSSNAILKLL